MLVQLRPERATVLVIDLQEKLLPAMQESQACLAAAGKLIAAANILNVSVVATEQYPAGLGTTCAPIMALMGTHKPHEKMAFSACIPAVRESIQSRQSDQIIVAGIEAHVCVQQSVMDLLRDGKGVWVCADAVSSRRAYDRDIALQRMQHAGAVITTAESVIFELTGQAGTEAFKKILRIVK